MRRVVTMLATAGLLLTGVITAPLAQAAPPQPEFTPAPLSWGRCDSLRLQAEGAECGTVAVPLDYDSPQGTQIELAVSRVLHKTPGDKYQGVMLVNPGGPGGSGLGLSVLGQAVPGGVGEAYDWIGFDPRGVGSSKPALSCIPDYADYNRPHYVPDRPEVDKAWLQRSTSYAAACERNGGELLDHLTTVDSARDMDSIRKALGSDQINFYGFSYGTYLGSVYATLFPQRVRRMVLDGNVNPTKVWEQANQDQDIAFDKNIKIYFDWVAKYDDVYHLGNSGADVEALYYRQYAELRNSPAGGLIGSSEWNDIFTQAGYYVFGWEEVATAFSNWVNNHDPVGLIALYPKPGDDNGYAVYLGVQCTDAKWPTYDGFRRTNERIYRQAPFLTWGNARFNAPCVAWPAKAGVPVEVDGKQAPAVLLISESLDAATPFSGSLELRREFPKSVLIEGTGGTTHAASLNGIPCVDNTIAEYLATGTLPARRSGNRSDLQCDPLPQPVPTGLVQAAQAGNGGAASRAGAPGVGLAPLRQGVPR